MSALGEYIHLHQENYLKYGTARNGETPQLLSESYNAQRSMNLARINALNGVVMESTITELKNRVQQNYNESKQAREIAQNHANYNKGIAKFQQSFKEKLLAEVPGKFGTGVAIRLNKSNMRMDKTLVNLNAAVASRNKALNAINTANNNFAMGKPVQERTIRSILDNTDAFFNAIGMIGGSSALWAHDDWHSQDTLAALQGILLLAPLDEVNQSAFSGAFGEVLVNMSADTARVLAGKELVKAMEAALKTGETRASFSIDETMVTPQVQQAFQEETDLNLYQAHSSQNKVDASITIKDQPVQASVKAYKAAGNTINTHLQDVSLLSTLAATEMQFANHWISLHSYGMASGSVDDALSEQVVYEALSRGNMLKQDVLTADTFVAIDVSTGRVYAKTMHDILTNNQDNFTLSPAISSIAVHGNNFADTIEQRIANILISIHQTKISVSYRVTLDPK